MTRIVIYKVLLILMSTLLGFVVWKFIEFPITLTSIVIGISVLSIEITVIMEMIREMKKGKN